MVHYTKVLAHKGLSEESLNSKTKKLIAKYNEAVQEAETIKNSRILSIWNCRTNSFTENGLKKYNSALGRAEDYNEFIIDSIAENDEGEIVVEKPIESNEEIIPSSTVVSNINDSGKQKRHNPKYFGMFDDDEDDE